jgi:hypothetical protein
VESTFTRLNAMNYGFSWPCPAIASEAQAAGAFRVISCAKVG